MVEYFRTTGGAGWRKPRTSSRLKWDIFNLYPGRRRGENHISPTQSWWGQEFRWFDLSGWFSLICLVHHIFKGKRVYSLVGEVSEDIQGQHWIGEKWLNPETNTLSKHKRWSRLLCALYHGQCPWYRNSNPTLSESSYLYLPKPILSVDSGGNQKSTSVINDNSAHGSTKIKP